MATRVFEIAKELGVQSKAIVAKCHAEGIPESVIKNHMSTVSAGLEATIREWFDPARSGTAVETAEKVELEKVTSPGKARARHAEDGDEAGGATTAVASPAPSAPARPAARTIVAPSGPAAPGAAAAGTTATTAPAAPAAGGAAIGAAASAPASPGAPAAARVQPGPIRTSGHVTPGGASSEAPGASTGSASRSAAARAAESGPQGGPEARDGRTGGPGGGGPGGGPGRGPRVISAPPGGGPSLPNKPAPMNVPTRPTVVTPAGPRIEEVQKKKISLSGPKVVRVEAAEQVDVPRPRGPRPGGGPRGPMGGGGGAPRGGMGVAGGEEFSRAGPGGGAGGAGAAGRRQRTDRRRPDDGVPDRRRGRAGGDVPDAAFTEADLAEREARLMRSGGYLKARRQQLRRQLGGERALSAASTGGKVVIAAPFTIKDLSAATGVKAADIVKKLFMQGVMATINSGIDPAKAQEVMIDWEIELDVTEAKTAEEKVAEQFVDRQAVDERARGPVVTILGHVDHGKTSLLDRIRNANVAAGEAGGITQATSAFRVPVKLGDDEKFVVFIDTPGHEAFTSMRSRGAKVTDIVVLVVAADDGVMPQTKESISHAKAAGVPLIVALNKIDKPEATDSNIQRILGQLANEGLNPVEWGGDTEVVRTSATKGSGIQELLEILDLQAQVLELKADHKGAARGTVIESRPEEGRGSVANLLVQEGELKVGDFIVAGRAYGRVRDITDDRGNRLKLAGPPMPVQISGIDELPDAGDKFYIVPTLKQAEQAAEQRRQREREAQLAQPKLTLDTMFSQMADKEIKEILVVLKADVQGSVDVLKHEIEKVGNEEVRTRVIHAAVGGITESDILLADASRAVIVGFNVIANAKGRQLAETKGIEIRNYDVIYNIVEDMQKACEGLLKPELRQEVLGHAEVRQVFRVTKVGMIAGCYVTDGTIERDALIRVTRNGVVIENDRRLEQLKRFKDDAKEVRSGMECGMKIAGYDDIKAGDVLECYKQIEVKRSL